MGPDICVCRSCKVYATCYISRNKLDVKVAELQSKLDRVVGHLKEWRHYKDYMGIGRAIDAALKESEA